MKLHRNTENIPQVHLDTVLSMQENQPKVTWTLTPGQMYFLAPSLPIANITQSKWLPKHLAGVHKLQEGARFAGVHC